MKKLSEPKLKVLKKMDSGYYLFWSVFGRIKNGYSKNFDRINDEIYVFDPIRINTIKALYHTGLIEITKICEGNTTFEKRYYYSLTEKGKQAAKS
jgi:Mn-dependent DtxR family transcriptional regulator